MVPELTVPPGSVDSEEDYALSRNTKMLISELLNTERAYVEDLRDVVVGT